jgi:hypothetical protein
VGGAAAALIAIIAAALLLRSRRRKKSLLRDSEPDLVEDHVVPVSPPKAEKSPAASIERGRHEVFNPYPRPNDNPQ